MYESRKVASPVKMAENLPSVSSPLKSGTRKRECSSMCELPKLRNIHNLKYIVENSDYSVHACAVLSELSPIANFIFTIYSDTLTLYKTCPKIELLMPMS